MTTYRGNTIYGTSTSAKVFKKSGIALAVYGDEYINTNGHHYKCVKRGKPDKAKWKYQYTEITGTPNGVSGIKITRSGSACTAAWTNPKNMTASTNSHRATGMNLSPFVTKQTPGNPNSNARWSTEVIYSSPDHTSYTWDLSNFRGWHRTDYYPYSGKPYLVSTGIVVIPKNAKGGWGTEKKFYFSSPDAPKFGNPSFNTSTGTVSVALTAAKSTEEKERLWTRYTVTTWDSSKPFATRKKVVQDSYTSSDSITLSYDAASYQELDSDQYIYVEFEAWSQGYAGDSKHVKADYTISFPKPVTIPTSADRHVRVTSRDSSGKCIVPVIVNYKNGFPVDVVKLQTLVNVAYPTPSDIPGEADWREPGAVDDMECTALVVPVGDVMPSVGRHSWVRVKAWHANEAALYSYSNIVEVPLYVEPPSAHDNQCSITSLSAGDDGSTLDCVVAWDSKSASGDEDTTGIELSWSEYAGAWKSTQAPQSYDFEWHDDEVDPSASADWNKSASIAIRGLTEGVAYHVRARCYTVTEDARTYGPYCDAVVRQTWSTPPSAVLSAPMAVPEGSGIPFEWTLSSAVPQTAWMIYQEGSSGDRVIASGEGGASSTVVGPDRVSTFAEDGLLSCRVRCTTGSEYVDSLPVLVRISPMPTCEVAAADVTAQPASFTVTCNEAGLEVAYTVEAYGSGSTGVPELGVASQPAGDVVASGTARPAFSASGGSYAATIFLQEGLDFRDGCEYVVRATATDAASGLVSEEAEATFSVEWARQAPEPPSDVYARTSDAAPVEGKRYYEWNAEEEAYEEVDEVDPSSMASYFEDVGIVAEPYDADGVRGCRLFLNAPDGAQAGDVYDVYRLTHDGAELAIGDVAPGSTVVDEFAAFGDSGDYGYRVACRTPDGDAAWGDFGYYAEGRCTRFDWDGDSVELPHGIAITDGYANDVEVQRRMDGSDVALYNAGAARTASLTNDIIRIEDADAAALVRSLAQHAGTAWVRTPDGSAYEADVQVRSMEVGRGAIAAAFAVQRVSATGSYGARLEEGD